VKATLSAAQAARLFLGAQGLLEDPGRPGTKTALSKLVHRLGFVQLDTINVVARAHDVTLFSRLHGYRPAHLGALVERDRVLFEHWTHDASLIPVAWYPHWRPRFRRSAELLKKSAWWAHHLGADGERVADHVRERITREGPLRSVDFKHEKKRGEWWGWTPQKAALEYLWRCGELAVARRVHFHKVYDLAERVYPQAHGQEEPVPEAHVEWVCAGAAERLGVFTPRELAGFWHAADAANTAAARKWCDRAAKDGRIVAVEVEGADDSGSQPACATADWSARLTRLPDAPEGIRVLSPFDPVIRDRARCLRRFGFDYRFEAFTPAARRAYGYYVMPLLEGERIVGRVDLKLHRDCGLLEVKGLWWDPGVNASSARKRKLVAALDNLAVFLDARVDGPARRRPGRPGRPPGRVGGA
jgi:uncharacterized protein